MIRQYVSLSDYNLLVDLNGSDKTLPRGEYFIELCKLSAARLVFCTRTKRGGEDQVAFFNQTHRNPSMGRATD